jgi:threonine synthase
MKFVSTRGKSGALSVSEAIQNGLAPDGGLYVPETFPNFKPEDFQVGMSYPEIATKVLAPFFVGDPLANQLSEKVSRAFSFPIPLKNSVLELFHGPTAAFKDVGARFLAECLDTGAHAPQTVLVATSGDTGGAVAAAFDGRKNFEVLILFPKNGVSDRQRQQLTCWGKNIRAFAVQGSFDVCQSLVKTALADLSVKEKRKVSSANSINIGRLLPQSTYYAMASLQHERATGRAASFMIPSGNLGNAVAAMWAKKMGFPIDKIGMATNANEVIPEFFKTGVWKPMPTVPTLANAMDVGSPSNMERVFHLEKEGFNLKENLLSASVSDEDIKKTIAQGEKKYGEIWCPHTATAVCLRERQASCADWIVVATAHPAKFETIVESLVGHSVEVPKPLLDLLALETVCGELSGDYAEFLQKLIKTP